MNAALAALFDMMYPIGSIYMSATLSTPAQVEAALGGTWAAWGAGRVPVGVDADDTDLDTAEETGGAKTHNHSLSDNGFAKVILKSNSRILYNEHAVSPWTANYGEDTSGAYNISEENQGWGAGLGGNTDTGGTMPPYITCYMYKRTA